MTKDLKSALPQIRTITHGMCMPHLGAGWGQGGGKSLLRALTYAKPSCSIVKAGSGGVGVESFS